jgi:hypothetical protein
VTRTGRVKVECSDQSLTFSIYKINGTNSGYITVSTRARVDEFFSSSLAILRNVLSYALERILALLQGRFEGLRIAKTAGRYLAGLQDVVMDVSGCVDRKH